MMGRQKKKKMIPQELQIQKMIQPTYGIITIKSVKIKCQTKKNWRKKIGRWKEKRKNRKNNDDGSAKEEEDDPPRIANPEDDTTDTWNRHCQISEKEGEQ